MQVGNLIKLDMRKQYIEMCYGNGIFLYDSNHNEYLDAIAGVGVVALGYGNKELAEALKQQALKIPYVHAMRFNNTPILELSDKMAEVAPFGLNWSFFVSGGSEATESAIKLTRQYFLEKGLPNKYKVIGRKKSFHGNTLMSLSVGGHEGRREKYKPLLVEMPHIEPPYCYRCPFGKAKGLCHLECAHSLEEKILEEDPDTISAFIMEPIVGAAAGCIGDIPGYMSIVRGICNKYDILLIVDEVMCGFGRTGKLFTVEHQGIKPDIIIFAKGISSGYAPLGGLLFSDKIGEAFVGGFEHNFTYAGNPLACSIGSKVIDIMIRDDIILQTEKKGEYLFKLLNERIAPHDCIGDIRGKGLFAGIEIVKDKVTKEPFSPSINPSKVLEYNALSEGLIIYPCTGTVDGKSGNHLLIMPPLVITEAEIDMLVERLERAVSKTEAEIS